MDYRELLFLTKLFADQLESAVPRITPRLLQDWPVLRSVVVEYLKHLTGPSPADVVTGLKGIGKTFSTAHWVDLDFKGSANLDSLEAPDPTDLADPDAKFVQEVEKLKLQIEVDVQRIVNETEAALLAKNFDSRITTGASEDNRPTHEPRVVRGTKSTRRAAKREAVTAPVEPRLRVRLSGEKVKGRAVQAGSSCRVTLDWGVLAEGALAELSGKELERARKSRLAITFVLYGGPFKVAGNRARIETQFLDSGFEKPVEFDLVAPANSGRAKIFIELRVQGRTTYRLLLELDVVANIEAVPLSAVAAPIKLDLDRLIEEYRRKQPAAILEIASAGAQASAQLDLLDPYEKVRCQHNGLKGTNLKEWMRQLAVRMDKVAKDPVWDKIADPLAPTADEAAALSDPLVTVADAGARMHDNLADFAGMKKILARIDALPPGSRIIVNVDEVAIPWELLYPPPLRKDQGADGIDVTRFWGYRFQFETYLTSATHDLPDGSPPAREQHQSAARKLTAVLNQEIDAERVWTAGAPVAYQRGEFEQARGTALSEIDITSDCDAARRLLENGKTDGAFIYFYCHGGADEQEHVELLQIDEQCRIEVDEVRGERTFTGAPIVFLNSCSSGPLASARLDSFCARLQHKGALGFITTSFAVPIPFAARFGCRLIIAYMKGDEALGDLLHELHKKALDARIPVSLFYMLRCYGDIRLPPLPK